MEGLFYNHTGITFLRFYADGRVIFYVKYNSLNQFIQTIPSLTTENENVHYSLGIYNVDIWDNIRIVIKGHFGKIEFHGFIRDENTIDLFHSWKIRSN